MNSRMSLLRPSREKEQNFSASAQLSMVNTRSSEPNSLMARYPVKRATPMVMNALILLNADGNRNNKIPINTGRAMICMAWVMIMVYSC